MREIHKATELKSSQCNSAKDYMRSVMYTVPLSELYKVVASCNYNEENEFCPVLVRIVDKQILALNDGLEFLLQVWTNKGDMVFEKPLETPVVNWNIKKNKFLFQEHTDSCEIYLVQLSTV